MKKQDEQKEFGKKLDILAVEARLVGISAFDVELTRSTAEHLNSGDITGSEADKFVKIVDEARLKAEKKMKEVV
jgi:hypothetical protein